MNENIINNKKEIVFLGDSITAWNPELKKIENSKIWVFPDLHQEILYGSCRETMRK